MGAKEAVVAVTYRCNAKCSMCNIWKETDHVEIASNEYAKLPRSLRTINITGGEPFLRSDLIELVHVMSKNLPNARLVFSTNGLLTERIVSTMEEIRGFHPNVGVGVSIDGRAALHDQIRGVTGMYDNALMTVKELKSRGFTDLRIGMTIIPENADEIPHIFEMSRELGIEFTTTVAHNSEIYFKKTDNIGLVSDRRIADPLRVLVRLQLQGYSVKDWLRAFHTNGIFDSDLRRNVATRCRAGKGYFFLAPNGDVFPCNVLNERIGNITQASEWNDLFTPETRRKVDNAVRDCRDDCWMVCNTRSMIKAHPVRVCAWVLKNKIWNQ